MRLRRTIKPQYTAIQYQEYNIQFNTSNASNRTPLHSMGSYTQLHTDVGQARTAERSVAESRQSTLTRRMSRHRLPIYAINRPKCREQFRTCSSLIIDLLYSTSFATGGAFFSIFSIAALSISLFNSIPHCLVNQKDQNDWSASVRLCLCLSSMGL